MTIVVCIKCSDGVALAADSMLSIGEMQHSGKKIQIIDQRSIFAFAGDLGLAERFKAFAVAEMPSIYDDPNMLTHAINISRLTADSFKSTHIEPITAQLQTIIVHPHQDKVEACLFLPFLNPRYLDSNHYYAVLGSGTSAALPFLAFLLESLNAEGGPPNLSDGKLFAAWAVTYAIQRLSGGVGGDINVAIATNGSDGATSQELSPENVEELKEHIRSATTYLKRWKQELSFNNSEPPPSPRSLPLNGGVMACYLVLPNLGEVNLSPSEARSLSQALADLFDRLAQERVGEGQTMRQALDAVLSAYPSSATATAGTTCGM